MKRIIVFGLGLLAVVFGLAHEGVIQRTNPPVNEKSELTKTFARINRAEDLAISEDGSFAWACTGLGEHGLYKFDLKTGEILKQYGPSYWFPQNLLAHKGKIYIVTEVQSEDRQNPNLLIVEEGSGKTIGKLALGDWRLYRTSSASLSPDGRWLWLTSAPTMSSLYGIVESALFRIDVQKGKCVRVAGPPSNKMNLAGFPSDLAERRRLVCIDKEGRVFSTDPNKPCLHVFDGLVPKILAEVKLDFIPSALPRRAGRYVPIAGGEKVVVLDTQSMSIVRQVNVGGRPTAVCVDVEGDTCFVATAGSNNVLQVNFQSGHVMRSIDLYRPGGKLIRDATRGKDVYDIVSLHWVDNPERLIALGYDGHLFIIARLNDAVDYITGD